MRVANHLTLCSSVYFQMRVSLLMKMATSKTNKMLKFLSLIGLYQFTFCSAGINRNKVNRNVHGTPWLNNDGNITRSLLSTKRSLSISPNNEKRQELVWGMIDKMDSYKVPPAYSESIDDRPTLTNFHYIIQPTWWRNQNQSDPSLLMDPNTIDVEMAKTVQYYSDMSWGKMKITYTILKQQAVNLESFAPTLQGARNGCINLLKKQGFQKGVDYDGIIFVHHLSTKGAFKYSGGLGLLTGDFIWIDKHAIDYKIIRHEIGHNLGHDHHARNAYGYRNSRPDLPSITDGFDMMGGGNGYAISDFSVASKWFYNWANDSSIVKMQPEGSTPECPTCISSGTFTMKPFDMRGSSPVSSDILGIHIPITTIFHERYRTDYLFSYWISYRSGVDGDASEGVQIHLAWFELYGVFGSYFDSMLLDSFGHTKSKMDSLVGEDSCYLVSPTAYMKDRDYISAEAVQPIICVDNINSGADVTVSISFLDPQNPPPPMVDLVKPPTIDCSSNNIQIQQSIDASTFTLFHVENSGGNGLLHASFDATDESNGSVAYFYDDYPYSPISFNSDPGYGSFALLTADSNNLSYKSDYGSTWILLPPTNVPGDSSVLTLTCEKTTICLRNHYLSGYGQCVQCPMDFTSDAGSTSVHDCTICPAGTNLLHPLSSSCSLSETFQQIEQAKGWRIWTPVFHSNSGWAWGVSSLSFYSDHDCQALISPLGIPINSANAGDGFGPENAFNSTETNNWGGRIDSDSSFWLGMMFDSLQSVKCVQVSSKTQHVNELRIQAYIDTEDRWENVWIQKSLDTTNWIVVNTIRLDYNEPPTSSPIQLANPPTFSPIKVTNPPTSLPTKVTENPTSSPIQLANPPTFSPIKVTNPPTSSPTLATENPTSLPTTVTEDPTSSPTLATEKPTSSPTLATENPTSSPVITVEVVPTKCTEQRSTKYLFRFNNRGKPVGRTCHSLTQKSKKFITKMCTKDIESSTKFDHAKVACPVTCGCNDGNLSAAPIASPVISPTSPPNTGLSASECKETGSTLYLSRLKQNGRPITRTCASLSQLSPMVRSNICANKVKSFQNFDPPSKACPVSCGCDKGANEVCEQNDNDEFLYKRVYFNGIPRAVTLTCSQLNSKSSTRISNICSKTLEFGGYLPANAVCFESCKSPC